MSELLRSERIAIIAALRGAVADLENDSLSKDGCVFLVGLLISLRDVANDPQLIAAREKAKACVYLKFEDATPEERAEAAPYLAQMESSPDERQLH